MNTKTTLTLAIAAVLAGGFVVAGAAFASPTDDVSPATNDLTDDPLPEDYDLEVIDPDGQLTDADVDRAIELAWDTDTLQEEFEPDEVAGITVQATGGTDEVSVVVTAEDGAAASADVDLESETVAAVLSDDRVHTVEDAETIGGAESLTVTGVDEDAETVNVTATAVDDETSVELAGDDTVSFTADGIEVEEIDDDKIQRIEVVPAEDLQEIDGEEFGDTDGS